MPLVKGLPYQDFARRVRDRRRKLGLQQAALGRLVGRDQAYISHLEHASGNPSLETILSLAAALDVELMLVPREKTVEVERLLGRSDVSSQPVTSVFDDVFVPDPDENSDHDR
jgi:transcriptional regulator with XRE-family HTH domain